VPCLDAVKGSADVRVVLPPLGPSVGVTKQGGPTRFLELSAR
jgi:hypothetical protein